jgi:hypothetical protein
MPPRPLGILGAIERARETTARLDAAPVSVTPSRRTFISGQLENTVSSIADQLPCLTTMDVGGT